MKNNIKYPYSYGNEVKYSYSNKKFNTRLQGMLNGDSIRDGILKVGMESTESTAYFFGNITKGIVDGSKTTVALHSGKRLGTTGFKAAKEFARGDVLCG